MEISKSRYLFSLYWPITHKRNEGGIVVFAYLKRITATLMLSLKVAWWFLLARLKSKNKNPSDASEKKSQEYIEEFTRLLSKELGAMKGPLMKVGQFLSMVDIVPKASQEHLESLLDNSKPIKNIHFARVIEKEFKVPCSTLFAKWENDVYATGSIGQVFKAELHDGTIVAVKIKYRDIEARVRGDMRVVKFFKYAIKIFFYRYNIFGTIEYLERIMLEECDLIQEAKNYKVLKKIFSGYDDLIIPEVYPKLCSRRVLTTKFYEGKRISEVLPSLSLEEKVKLNEMVERFYVYPIQRYNFIQIDPHLGNFLCHDGKLVCLDFGGMHIIEQSVAKVFNEFIQFAKSGNTIALYKLFVTEGLVDAELITLPVFTKYMAKAIIDPYGFDNNEGLNNLNFYFKNYPREPLRSGVVTRDADLPLFVLTYFMFRAFEKRILD